MILNFFLLILSLFIFSNTVEGRFPHGIALRIPNDDRASSSILIARTDLIPNDFAKNEFFAGVIKNIRILKNGIISFFPRMTDAQRLLTMKKQKGPKNLTYTQFKQVAQGQEDTWKAVRLMLTLPLSPEFFFYSYIVFPLFSGSNPWAWKAMPSMFDDSQNAEMRRKIVYKRKFQALVSSIFHLQAEALDEAPEKVKNARIGQLAIIRSALDLCHSSVDKALEALHPLLVDSSPVKGRGKKVALKLDSVPAAAVKESVRAIGVDGVPNLPLINRLNKGDLKKYFDMLREQDDFLSQVGSATLTLNELQDACTERGIGTNGKTVTSLRGELNNWLALASKPQKSVNEQNRRLALLALNVARDFRFAGSDITGAYAALLKK